MSAPANAWVEPFLDRVLALWREHADTPNALFDPYLDQEWRHDTDGPRTLVTQCRLIYNFARAFERSGDPAFADLAHRGIDALVRFFRAPGDEGWSWSCRGDGTVLDDVSDAYGHAFVILALSTAAGTLSEFRYRDLALDTWSFMQRRFRDRHGGLIWHINRDGQIAADVRSQNPMMHTFEALIELAPMDESGMAREGARQIWQFLRERMPTLGALPEWYDSEWRPLTTGPRAIVEVGHVYEWAFLLSEASSLFVEDDLPAVGRQMLDFGMRHGYDADQGGIYAQVDYDGRLVQHRKGWWEQCEAIRAMQRYVARHGAGEIAAPLEHSLAFVRQHFVDDEFGGWYSNPPGLGDELSLRKGHVYKLDYHVVNMCRELVAAY